MKHQMHDPQNMNPQYLEDLATGYWHSEILFTAVERELFTRLEPDGKTVAALADELQYDQEATKRFVHALAALGLVYEADGYCGNTKLARKYLVKGDEAYQGDSILWRKYLVDNWKELDKCLEKGTRVSFPSSEEPEEVVKRRFRRYCTAMDCVVKNKLEEVLSLFSGLELHGNILDVGSGLGAFSAAFLKRFSDIEATLLDMDQVVEYAEEIHAGQPYADRIDHHPADILQSWDLPHCRYGLVILSNIVHAFAEAETGHVLSEAVNCLSEDGFLLVHDFFMEHSPEKAAMSDLNMLVNTYNGKVFPAAWVREQLKNAGLAVTELIPLDSDTAVLVAAKRSDRLAELCIGEVRQLSMRIRAMGFQRAMPIELTSVHVPDWVDLKCRFGCAAYGHGHCPPNSMTPEKTRAMLKDYSTCLLLQGEPPTADFQKRVLKAERLAFKAGYHRAFSLWAGPCSICKECGGAGNCINPKNARPSMEGSGIDVFETVRRAGLSIKTLPEKDDYVKYFALLLLE